jgi:polyphosphate kinase
MGRRDGKYSLLDRETSWLRFGDRVLQEAEDPEVPLFERLFFCGIFSSNLDEYFRVRVASLRSLLRLRRKAAAKLGISPGRLLHDIHRIVDAQQERYGAILAGILGQLAGTGIRIVDDLSVDSAHRAFLRETFLERLRDRLRPEPLEDGDDAPFLKNQTVYLVVELWDRSTDRPRSWIPAHALVEVPQDLPRFVVLPERGGGHEVMFLDDVIRCNLDELFPDSEVERAWAVKLTRDAELYLEDEFDGDLVEAIRKHLRDRETGVPSRFLYDMRTPWVLVRRLQDRLGLMDEDMVRGGRYHNLHDFMVFPRFGRAALCNPAWPPLPHPALDGAETVIDAIGERDRVLHTPYQSFEHFQRFLDEAAADPAVEEIRLTVYRVARDSTVLNALVRAARAGKRVTVFFEVQARFDEESNLEWADRLEAAGATTLYSMKGLKVHAKIALVVRRQDGERHLAAYIGTGNFNEKTARVYADHGIFTCDPQITRDVEQVFAFLEGEIETPVTEQLLVAPFTLRQSLEDLIAAEAEYARAGQPSGIMLKLNALEDADIIERLYDASEAGVPIDIIVRGICRLVPGVAGQSETIRVRSILDRYLEHARIFRFHARGEDRLYLASADWMRRNLSRRVEVAVPIHDDDVRRQLLRLLELQLADNRKARVIDAEGRNPYARDDATPPLRSQEAFRDFLAAQAGA